MNNKLFLGIIIIFALLSSMIIPVIEGVCNYEDDTEITGVQEGDVDGDGDVDINADGGVDTTGSGYSLAGKGAPVKNASSESCNEAQTYQNAERIKLANVKLNELKAIHKRTKDNVFNNFKQIKQNMNNRKKMASLVDDNEEGGTNDACKKYPEACDDE